MSAPKAAAGLDRGNGHRQRRRQPHRLPVDQLGRQPRHHPQWRDRTLLRQQHRRQRHHHRERGFDVVHREQRQRRAGALHRQCRRRLRHDHRWPSPARRRARSRAPAPSGLGSKQLTVGATNLSTTVSGVIADGGRNGGAGGSLVKVGTGHADPDRRQHLHRRHDGQCRQPGRERQPGQHGHAGHGGTIGGTGTIGGLVDQRRHAGARQLDRHAQRQRQLQPDRRHLQSSRPMPQGQSDRVNVSRHRRPSTAARCRWWPRPAATAPARPTPSSMPRAASPAPTPASPATSPS